MTRQHLGILLTLGGTVSLAFSVKVVRQYEGELAAIVDREKKEAGNLLEPTETMINRHLFWLGLLLVAIGALLQW